MIVESGTGTPFSVKYPSTPYWPWSPAIGRDVDVHPNPGRFVGESVVVTEKLDGGSTLLHSGKVYARSVSAPSDGKWMAMAKKHHAWKVNEPDVYLYGEDIYAVHSIAYGPVAEEDTFHAFALRNGDGVFAAFAEVEAYANCREIPVVPVLFRGCFRSVTAIRAFIKHAHGEPSVLGVSGRGSYCGWRESSRLRNSRTTSARAFALTMCRRTNIGPENGGGAGSHGVPDEMNRPRKTRLGVSLERSCGSQ